MKTFRHKKTGDVAELVSTSGYKLNKSTIGLIPKEYIENSSDWVEVVEREWKILDTNISDDLEQSISSVKRLSDGEIFSIGDKLTEGIIFKFDLFKYNDGIYAYAKRAIDNGMYTCIGVPLDKWVKSKKPLFTAEDGVDIFKGDKIWYCIHNNTTLYESIASTDYHNGTISKYIYFSTKEAAENYIICNKPCLSFNDVWNISNNKSSDNHYVIIDKRELKKLVKSKL